MPEQRKILGRDVVHVDVELVALDGQAKSGLLASGAQRHLAHVRDGLDARQRSNSLHQLTLKSRDARIVTARARESADDYGDVAVVEAGIDGVSGIQRTQ